MYAWRLMSKWIKENWSFSSFSSLHIHILSITHSILCLFINFIIRYCCSTYFNIVEILTSTFFHWRALKFLCCVNFAAIYDIDFTYDSIFPCAKNVLRIFSFFSLCQDLCKEMFHKKTKWRKSYKMKEKYGGRIIYSYYLFVVVRQ